MPRNPNVRRRRRSASKPFPVRSKVEVRTNEAGFEGAWFEATVTKTPSSDHRHRRYHVTYSSLITAAAASDKKQKQPLREAVYGSLIRPRPPRQRHPGGDVFVIHQQVEAFHNDAWWPGVVVKLPANADADGMYTICFPMTREELGFGAAELRWRLEWVDEKWVSIDDEDAQPPQEGEHDMFCEGTRVEVSGDKEKFGAVWFTATVLKVIGTRYFLVEYENLTVDNNNCTESRKEIVDVLYLRPYPPEAKSTTSFNVLNEVEVFHKDGWYFGVISVILLGPRYMVRCKHEEDLVEFDSNSLRPCHVWNDGQWLQTSQGKDMERPSLESGNKSSQPCKKLKKGNMQEEHSKVDAKIHSIEEKKLIDGSSVANLKDHDTKRPGLESGNKLAQPCKKLKKRNLLEEQSELDTENDSVRQFSRRQRSPIRKVKQPSFRLHSPELTRSNNDGEVAGISGVSNLTNKKVVKCSLEVNSSQPSNNDGKAPSGNDQPCLTEDRIELSIPNAKSPLSRSFFRICGDKLASSGTEKETETLHSMEGIIHDRRELIIRCPSYKVAERETAPDPTLNVSLSKENSICNVNESCPRRLSSEKAFVEVDDVSDHTMLIMVPHGSLSEKTVAVDMEEGLTPNGPFPSSRNVSDHYESNPSVLPSVSSSFVNDTEEIQSYFSVPGDNSRESKGKALAENSTEDITPQSDEQAVLPFTKNPQLWDFLESNEVFRTFPQQPHFRPLFQHEKESREGVACGLMVNFVNVVTGVKNLKIADPEEEFEGKLKVLVNLEEHGFNIQPVRARLEKLVEMCSISSESKCKKNSLEARVQELEEVKGKYNLLLSELEESISRLKERREAVMVKISKDESEILNMNTDVRAAEDEYSSAELKFCALSTVPW